VFAFSASSNRDSFSQSTSLKMRRDALYLLWAAFAAFTHAASDHGEPGAPTATIDAGIVIGKTTQLPAATAAVNQFLGIPFAKSPPARFMPAEKPDKFKEPIVATSWSPACIQQFVCKTGRFPSQ
jgi:acetylcholinesterase